MLRQGCLATVLHIPNGIKPLGPRGLHRGRLRRTGEKKAGRHIGNTELGRSK